MELTEFIRDIVDFPRPGIIFKDITPLLNNNQAFKRAVDLMAVMVEPAGFDSIVCAEARGFIFGGALAYKLNRGFVPVRKPGKLPFKTLSQSYDLEYGQDSMEIHEDSVKPGEQVLLVDDLLATGGTSRALINLVEKLGAKVAGIAFLIELSGLKGREKLKPYPVFSLIKF